VNSTIVQPGQVIVARRSRHSRAILELTQNPPSRDRDPLARRLYLHVVDSRLQGRVTNTETVTGQPISRDDDPIEIDEIGIRLHDTDHAAGSHSARRISVV
jgi:hypothetical protein